MRPKTIGLPKFLFSIIPFLVLSGLASGQGKGDDDPSSAVPKSVISPSPEGASLGKYGDIPISLFKGIPEVNIPMYTIQKGNITLPVSINYSSSGIKVNEIATNVGLGWTLSAGGAVTSATNDKSDFRYAKTLPINTSNFNPNSGIADADYEFAKNYIKGTGLYDLQPDYFYYNFCGNSGKFFFDAENQVGYSIPKNDYKIYRDSNGLRFTDIRGTVYTFNSGELSSVGDSVVTGSPKPALGIPFVQTLYLTKIQDAKGNILNLEYTPTQYKYVSGCEEVKYQLIPNNASCPTIGPSIIYKIQRIVGPKIKRISSSDNSVEILFRYSATDREDLEYVSSSADSVSALNQVIVRSFGKVIKTFSLDHDYFRTTNYSPNEPANVKALKTRLKLTSVTESGNKPYLFNYEESVALPARLSFAADYWGYYNGKNSNLTGIPTNPTYNFTGANRDPDPAFTQAGILKKVTYPTGGFTNINYQQNVQVKYQSVPIVTPVINGYTAEANKRTSGQLIITGFVQSVTITYYLDGGGRSQSSANISSPNGFNMDLSGTGSQSQVLLPAGTYTISMNNSFGIQSIGMNISWNVYSSVDQLVTTNHGGVRVWQTIDQPGSGLAVKKYYRYNIDGSDTSVISSLVGRGFSPLNFVTPLTQSRYDTKNDFVYDCRYNVLYANPVPLLGKGAPDNYGYRKVTILTDSSGIIGKTINTYTLKFDDFTNTNNIDPINDKSWVMGELLQQDQLYFDSNTRQYFPIKRTRNHYVLNLNSAYLNNNEDANRPPNQYSVYGMQILQTKPEYAWPNNSSRFELATFEVEVFPFVSAWYYLSQKEEYTFTPGDSTKVVFNSINYFYDNPIHLQMTRSVMNKSNGKELTSITTYPDDYASGSPFIDNMRNNHLSGLPLEQVTYQNDGANTQILSGQISHYDNAAKGLVDTVYKFESNLPVAQSAFKFSDRTIGQLPYGTTSLAYNADIRYKKKLSYSYDNKGNIQSVSIENGPKTTYLWSYNGQYPVIEIKNADYATVAGILGSTAITNLNTSNPNKSAVDAIVATLKNNAQLKGAQMTSYTYAPLVGMTSMTDAKGETTTYEYDSFQRLIDIKDKNGKVIKHMDYHYQGQ